MWDSSAGDSPALGGAIAVFSNELDWTILRAVTSRPSAASLQDEGMVEPDEDVGMPARPVSSGGEPIDYRALQVPSSSRSNDVGGVNYVCVWVCVGKRLTRSSLPG